MINKPSSVANASTAPPSQQIPLGHGPELDEIASRYPNVFCDQIRGITGEPAKIKLTPDAQLIAWDALLIQLSKGNSTVW